VETIDRLQELSERILTPDRSAKDSGFHDGWYDREFNPHRLSNGWPVLLEEGTPEWHDYSDAYWKNVFTKNQKDYGDGFGY
jgi:hypothetical protein